MEEKMLIEQDEKDLKYSELYKKMFEEFSAYNEKELLNEQRRLQLKMYENEITDVAFSTKLYLQTIPISISITALIFTIFSILRSDIGVKVTLFDIFEFSFILFILLAGCAILPIALGLDIKKNNKRVETCVRCKIALRCIEDIFKESLPNKTNINNNSPKKRFYIEVEEKN